MAGKHTIQANKERSKQEVFMKNSTIPLSGSAEFALFDKTAGITCLTLFAASIAAIVGGCSTRSWTMTGMISLTTACVVFGGLFPWYLRARRNIRGENAEDFARANELRDLLGSLMAKAPVDFAVAEQNIAGMWKPFRIEHLVSGFLREQIHGKVSLSIFDNVSGRGSFSGTGSGGVVPNLLDTSSMMFLMGEHETLRVLIPSPKATKEMLIRLVEKFMDKAWRKYTFSSHVYDAIHEYLEPSDDLHVIPFSHPAFLDAIDVASRLPIAERPSVVVSGEYIQDGVVLATAIEFNGKRSVFLPSGFFAQLAESLRPYVAVESPQPQEALARA